MHACMHACIIYIYTYTFYCMYTVYVCTLSCMSLFISHYLFGDVLMFSVVKSPKHLLIDSPVNFCLNFGPEKCIKMPELDGDIYRKFYI